jgi:inner membrane protein
LDLQEKEMKNTLLSKLLAMGALLLMSAIPLSMVTGIVGQRASYRDSATQEIANAHAREQTVTGPVLYWPYVHTNKLEKDQTIETKAHALVHAKSLHTQSKLNTQTRWRGIFPVTVYTSVHVVKGSFRLDSTKITRAVGTQGRLTVGQAWLLLSISDMRGITGVAKLNGFAKPRIQQRARGGC